MTEAIALSPQHSTVPKFVSIDAYYRAEEKSLTKNEYHDGIIIPTAGAKLKHNRLALRAGHIFEDFVETNDANFIVSNGDTKIRIEDFNKIVYPDAVVICETPQYYNKREDTITNPLLVVEILSVSTMQYDRKMKFEMYRTIPSFREYVLIYQDRKHVTVWTKQADGAWLPKDYTGDESVAILHSLGGCPLSLAKLYKNL